MSFNMTITPADILTRLPLYLRISRMYEEEIHTAGVSRVFDSFMGWAGYTVGLIYGDVSSRASYTITCRIPDVVIATLRDWKTTQLW